MARPKKPGGPQFVKYFGPVLNALRTLGGSGTGNEAVEQVIQDLKIPDEEQNEITSSGGRRVPNQIAWARFYLTRAGLLDSSKRGVWSLTPKGWDTHLSPQGAKEVFDELAKEFRAERKQRLDEEEPEEALAEEAGTVADDYRGRLLGMIRELPPEGFERLCQRLLRESGFVQVVVTGRSGDEGIDGYGTLQINPFVTFKVLFQCKRYRNTTVTPSQVRDFRGAMQGRADKGIIMTTGNFTAEARREASRDGAPPIELVDADSLVAMFERLEIGLRPVQTYEVDAGFFAEFQQKAGG